MSSIIFIIQVDFFFFFEWIIQVDLIFITHHVLKIKKNKITALLIKSTRTGAIKMSSNPHYTNCRYIHLQTSNFKQLPQNSLITPKLDKIYNFLHLPLKIW